MNANSDVYYSELVSNRWTVPRPASFGSKLFDSDDPCFSPDGQRLFFTSWRPAKWYRLFPSKERIWYVEKRERGWSKPRPVAEAINSMHVHWQMSVAENQSLYFASEGDIYRSFFVDGQYVTPEQLPDPINSGFREGTPFVSPDEGYLIFGSSRSDDSRGMDDLYLSFRLSDGSWSQVLNLGPDVNSSAHELCPYVSPDGKYLFFLSGREGTYNVYWMDTQVIERLRSGVD
jgi:Tol biopolymer transport system component